MSSDRKNEPLLDYRAREVFHSRVLQCGEGDKSTKHDSATVLIIWGPKLHVRLNMTLPKESMSPSRQSARPASWKICSEPWHDVWFPPGSYDSLAFFGGSWGFEGFLRVEGAMPQGPVLQGSRRVGLAV